MKSEGLIQTKNWNPIWEGNYQVIKCNENGSYKLQDFEGKILARTWNNVNLGNYFP